ncbi:hypothetical protein EMIHUDRAFT_352291, partial [Emiliania huxleyi CCMP1516]|uniref:Uncharacterized protein n=2 Tax=Emiliania huxleyi TaxID=2903 RepID=A0A0D3KEX1_EMIH1
HALSARPTPLSARPPPWLRSRLSATAAPANAARPSPRSCSRQCSTELRVEKERQDKELCAWGRGLDWRPWEAVAPTSVECGVFSLDL